MGTHRVIMKVLLLLSCIGAAVAISEEVHDFECGGGSGGKYFDDSSYAQYGDITGFEIWHGTTTCVIDGIRLRYGTVWGPTHNGGGNPKDRVDFQAGEYITAVDMDKRTHWGYEVLCKVTIFTNQRAYGPYCNYSCSSQKCGASQQGNFKYISGSFGANLDFLTWHE